MTPPERTTVRLGRQRDVDSAETRRRLIDASRRIFARQGYDVTTNRHIATAAGITPGAIYHYFPSKADLYAAVYEDAQIRVTEAFEASIVGRTTFVDRFWAALDAAVDLDRQDSSYAGFLVGVAADARRHRDVAQALVPHRGLGSRFLRTIVLDAQAAGELADDVDVGGLEDLLAIALTGLANFSNVTNDPRRHGAAIQVLKHLVAGTVLRAPAAGR